MPPKHLLNSGVTPTSHSIVQLTFLDPLNVFIHHANDFSHPHGRPHSQAKGGRMTPEYCFERWFVECR